MLNLLCIMKLVAGRAFAEHCGSRRALHRDFLPKKYPCSAKALLRKEFRNSRYSRYRLTKSAHEWETSHHLADTRSGVFSLLSHSYSSPTLRSGLRPKRRSCIFALIRTASRRSFLAKGDIGIVFCNLLFGASCFYSKKLTSTDPHKSPLT